MQVRLVPTRTNAALLAICLVCTGVVIVAVNTLIYRARIVFGQNNPDYIAIEPATISRAISDPIVGVSFANWMAICAPLLTVGVLALLVAQWRELQRGGGAVSRQDQIAIATLSIAVGILQTLGSVGMVILSHYRFPNHHEMHMTGSYLFFFSQASVVIFGEVLARRLAHQPWDRVLTSLTMMRVRRIYVWVPALLGVVYLTLFVLKGYDLGGINTGLYVAYTIAEPLLISSFLGYILTYHFDIWASLLRYLRA